MNLTQISQKVDSQEFITKFLAGGSLALVAGAISAFFIAQQPLLFIGLTTASSCVLTGTGFSGFHYSILKSKLKGLNDFEIEFKKLSDESKKINVEIAILNLLLSTYQNDVEKYDSSLGMREIGRNFNEGVSNDIDKFSKVYQEITGSLDINNESLKDGILAILQTYQKEETIAFEYCQKLTVPLGLPSTQNGAVRIWEIIFSETMGRNPSDEELKKALKYNFYSELRDEALSIIYQLKNEIRNFDETYRVHQDKIKELTNSLNIENIEEILEVKVAKLTEIQTKMWELKLRVKNLASFLSEF